MLKSRASLLIVTLLIISLTLWGLNQIVLFHSLGSIPLFESQQWLLFSQSYLPRFFVSLLAGAALGLCGWLAQLVLKNPLAEPATLGVASGAQLGVTVALFIGGSALLTQGLALFGGLITTGVIYLLSSKRGMAPLTLLLTGMILGLFCSALQNGLVLFNHEQMQSLFIWNSGDLAQNDWSVVLHLTPLLAIIVSVLWLSARALNLLRLSDDVVDSMGGNSRGYRLLALTLMAILASWTVSQVGVVSFIGLFAPQFVRLFPGYPFKKQLCLVMIFGAVILLLCDQIAVLAESYHWQLSAGNLTAIIGIPLMLVIIIRARFPRPPQLGASSARCWTLPRAYWPGVVLMISAVIIAALALTRSPTGFIFNIDDPFQLRWPRALLAGACGGLLASSGVILQRLTGNPLASPEVLGINSGAACAVVLTLILVPTAGGLLLFPAAAAGAFISLLLIMLFALNATNQASAKILLVGTTLSAFSLALITLFLATGAPNASIILTWLSGSTWSATPSSAITALLCLMGSLPISLLFTRWLTLLPLGKTVASSLGLSIKLSSSVLIIWCALLSATATLLLGPMSFIGLLAPQVARFIGMRRYPAILITSVVFGGGLMLSADWLGRIVIWPFQIPAGIIAVILGAPGLLYLLYRQK